MQVRTVRKPGGRGTERLVEKYRKRLAGVRYRYDPDKRKRYKTVELIIAEESWIPAPQSLADNSQPLGQPEHTSRVLARISYYEKDLQRQVKAIGGT